MIGGGAAAGAASRPRTLAAALFLLTLAAYARTAGYGYVNFDDDVHVFGNPPVMRGLTADTVRWAVTTPHAGNWMPLTWLSHAADAQIFGRWAGGHHLTGILLHAAAAAMLFLVLRAMTGATGPGLFTAAMFALHPQHVESVAWITERKDVLAGCFWVASLAAHLRFARSPGASRYGLVLACFLLALMSKPIVVTLPFVLILLDWWPLGRFRGPGGGARRARRLLLEKLPLLALAGAVSWLTFASQQRAGAVRPLVAYSLPDRLANVLLSYATYLRRTVWPDDLAFFYPLRNAPLLSWSVAGAVILLMSVSFLALRHHRRAPWLAAGWLWYLGTLVPVIGLVQVGDQAMADRYTYLPLIGVFMAVAWGASRISSRPSRRTWLTAAGLLLTAAAAAGTFRQAGFWRDNETLFGRALQLDGGNWMAHLNMGTYRALQGRKDQAEMHFRVAAGLWPESWKAHANLARVLEERGAYGEALEELRKALVISPDRSGLHVQIGVMLGGIGDHRMAEESFRTALRLDPADAGARYNLAVSLERQGRRDEADEEYRRLPPPGAGGGEGGAKTPW